MYLFLFKVLRSPNFDDSRSGKTVIHKKKNQFTASLVPDYGSDYTSSDDDQGTKKTHQYKLNVYLHPDIPQALLLRVHPLRIPTAQHPR